jgi:hypothetical protein
MAYKATEPRTGSKSGDNQLKSKNHYKPGYRNEQSVLMEQCNADQDGSKQEEL